MPDLRNLARRVLLPALIALLAACGGAATPAAVPAGGALTIATSSKILPDSGQHAELIAGRIGVDPPSQRAPLRVKFAATARRDARRHLVGILARVESDSEVQPVLARSRGG